MSLLNFQTTLGRAIREKTQVNPLDWESLTADERRRFSTIIDSAGFRFTSKVQRSWSAARATKAANLALSILPPEQRRTLVEEWVNSGGGTASFVAWEAEAFLGFIARHLPDPSHELTLCRMEQATLRADEGVRHFVTPDLARLNSTDCLLHRGRYAAIVEFYAEPHLVLDALTGKPFPPVAHRAVSNLLFSPGLIGLFREATVEEAGLWAHLVEPMNITTLLRLGHCRGSIETLLLAAGIEYQEDRVANQNGKRFRAPDGL